MPQGINMGKAIGAGMCVAHGAAFILPGICPFCDEEARTRPASGAAGPNTGKATEAELLPTCAACGWKVPDDYTRRYCGGCGQDMIRAEIQKRRAPLTGEAELLRYDAGLLGDGGGGDVDWWQDYIRAELDRAHEFYSAQFVSHAPLTGGDELVERLRRGTTWSHGEPIGATVGAVNDPVMSEAADRITALYAEIAKLTNERDLAEQDKCERGDRIAAQSSLIAELREAGKDALRELDCIAACIYHDDQRGEVQAVADAFRQVLSNADGGQQ